MANLPSQHPTLSIHLSDLTLTPLITSSSSPSHLESLTSLTASALSTHTAVRRANLGRPQRIMVEYLDAGPVVLHTYLHSCEADDASPAHIRQGPADSRSGPGPQSDHARPEDSAPMLVGVVVAPTSDEARDARRAAVRLEKIGRQFQREWIAQAAADRFSDAGTE